MGGGDVASGLCQRMAAVVAVLRAYKVCLDETGVVCWRFLLEDLLGLLAQ